MPAIKWTPLVDQDEITADSLNDRFSAVALGINGIMAEGVRPGALSTQHFDGGLVQADGWQDSGKNMLVATMKDPLAITSVYTTYGENGAKDRQPVQNSSGALELTHSGGGVTLGMDQADRIAGLLVFYNLEFWDDVRDGAGYCRLMTCLQFNTGGTLWYTIPRTERIMQERDVPGWVTGGTTRNHQDCATATLITQQDLINAGLSANAKVSGVRVMAAVVTDGAGKIPQATVRNGRLSLLPLHAELV